ncbi:Small-conductance mechanosensitive channel [Moraxella caprae]|uniref:Small-conductance mechanosensitive channel n=1 Tax=Moraxella caprae TaxID=90240 RepID=A0A378R2F8_9GAMM|nr:mechanosensitive ion channel domain-containing protein [Moraxella caprae]STZ09506.1 Small-conductance mechanosensitive channel [Moraxella caprae]
MTEDTKQTPSPILGELKNSAEESAERLETTASRTGEVVAETTREVVTGTTRTVETASDYTLELLGITVDTRTLIANSAEFAVKAVLAIIIFYVGKWIGKHIVNLAKRAMVRSSVDGTAVSFLGNLLYGVMLAAVILASLNQLGISTTSFVAVLGAMTVAIGVSLKDQVSNLAAGVLIVVFHPFRRGDYVEVGGQTGTVQEITLVNTRIRTPNNHEVIIPNGDIMTSASINYSSLPNRRIEVPVGIGYDSDIKTARHIMMQMAQEHELVLKDPEPIVRVTELADSSVNLIMYVWTNNNDWWAVQCDLLERIKYAFDEAGINIPFPIRTLQIDGLDDMLMAAKGIDNHEAKMK